MHVNIFLFHEIQFNLPARKRKKKKKPNTHTHSLSLTQRTNNQQISSITKPPRYIKISRLTDSQALHLHDNTNIIFNTIIKSWQGEQDILIGIKQINMHMTDYEVTKLTSYMFCFYRWFF